jgi:hypothetical protein
LILEAYKAGEQNHVLHFYIKLIGFSRIFIKSVNSVRQVHSVVVGYNLREMSSNKELYKHSFFPRTISDWNKLPEPKALSPDLESFKSCISALTFEGFISSDLNLLLVNVHIVNSYMFSTFCFINGL